MRIVCLFATLVALIQTAAAQTPEWIWFNKTSETETRYFRKALSIDGKVAKAELVATADDELVVFVNGEQVLSASSWQNGHKADVTSQLKPGANVLAIRAKNADASPAGAIAQLTITTDKGKQIIVTDASWKAAERSAPNWNKPGFDETGWRSEERRVGKECA